MVRFDWKFPEKEQFPPEPQTTRNAWKQDHKDWDKWEVIDWYSETFEMYACKLKGEDSPVPSQLYYIGDREWMTDSGWVLEDGHVEAWDSYTDDNIGKDNDDPYVEGTIKIDGLDFHANLTSNSRGLLCAAAYLALLFKQNESMNSTDVILSDIGKIIEYLEEEECTE